MACTAVVGSMAAVARLADMLEPPNSDISVARIAVAERH